MCVELIEKEKVVFFKKELCMYMLVGMEIVFCDVCLVIVVCVLGFYKKMVELKEVLWEVKDVFVRMMVNVEYLGLGFDCGCELVFVLCESL